ncbi:MAG: SRPBCC domain-containing protein [Pseudomonadota bacterium]
MHAFFQSPPGDDPVVSRIVLAASPQRAFHAWTDPEEVKAWFGHKPNSLPRAEIDLRVGGEWLFVFNANETGFSAVGGRYLVVEANHRLVFTWCHRQSNESGGIHESASSEVDVSFAPGDDGCVLTVTHRNIANGQGRRNVKDGWSRALHSLAQNVALVEKGPQRR